MEEKVGICSVCGKTIYCLDGFLNGVVSPDKDLYCFSCTEDEE